MTSIVKSVAAAFAVLMLAPNTANAQTSNGALSLLAEQGFTMSEVHVIAGLTGYQGELQQLPTGDQFGVYNTEDGRTFIVKPDFCGTGKCLGLVIGAFYPADEFSATYQQLNEFNVTRPHGNASYVDENSTFVVQRVLFNISGVTIGNLAGEFGVFEGYSRAFDTYIRGLNGTANTIAFNDDADDAKTSNILTYGIDGAPTTADNLFAPSNAAREILSDSIANGSVQAIYYRQEVE